MVPERIKTFSAQRIMELWEADFSAKLHIDDTKKGAEHWAYRLSQAGVTEDSGPELYASFQRGWFNKRKPSLRDFLAHCRAAKKEVKIAPGEVAPKETCAYCGGSGAVDVICPIKEHGVIDPVFEFGKPYEGEYRFYQFCVACDCTVGQNTNWGRTGPEWFRLKGQVLDVFRAEHKAGFNGSLRGMVMRILTEYTELQRQGQPAQPRPTARQRVSPSATTPPANANESTLENRQAAPLLDVSEDEIPF